MPIIDAYDNSAERFPFKQVVCVFFSFEADICELHIEVHDSVPLYPKPLGQTWLKCTPGAPEICS